MRSSTSVVSASSPSSATCISAPSTKFRDGGLHPGYAFPLWHAFLALVAKVAGTDPTNVVLHEPSALAPVAFAVVYEAGVALFRSASLGVGVLAATVALTVFAPGHGGSYALLAQPGTLDRHVLVPAALTLFFLFLRHPGWPLALALAAVGVEVFLVHASSAVFLGIVLLGFFVVRVLLVRTELPAFAAGLASLFEPAGARALVAVPDRPRDEVPLSVRVRAPPLPRQVRGRAARRVAASLCTPSGGDLAWRSCCDCGAPEHSARRTRRRQRWAAFVLGGSLVILGIELSIWVFPHFADAVSVSQARRLAGFVPFAFAITGGASVLAALIGALARRRWGLRRESACSSHTPATSGPG